MVHSSFELLSFLRASIWLPNAWFQLQFRGALLRRIHYESLSDEVIWVHRVFVRFIICRFAWTIWIGRCASVGSLIKNLESIADSIVMPSLIHFL